MSYLFSGFLAGSFFGGLPTGLTERIFSITDGLYIPVLPISLSGFTPSLNSLALAAVWLTPSFSAISLMVISFIGLIITYQIISVNRKNNDINTIFTIQSYSEINKNFAFFENIFQNHLT